MASSFIAICLTLAIIFVCLYGLIACAYAIYIQKKKIIPSTADFFLTARNSVKTFFVAWSFYAGAMGSWALFGPPSYVLVAGVIGLVSYSISSGIPIFIIGVFGNILRNNCPNVLSFSDFVTRRFGKLAGLYIGCITLFNMGVAISAEYTAVGDLFAFVIHTSRIPIVIIIGVVSMLYTAAGGLYVSIITDQWQAITSVVLVIIVAIFVSATFDKDLKSLPSNYLGFYDLTGTNKSGYDSILVMPISLISSTFFSEAMWQRCWASSDSKSLKIGSIIATFAVIIVVFFFGFVGLLAAWGGIWTPESDSDYGTTIMFSIINEKWILVIVCILSVTMTESAVDSLQNGLANTMSTVFILPHFGKVHVMWIRLLVLALNVPPVIVSLRGYYILQLFLLANLITSTALIPLVLGVIPGRTVQKLLTPFSFFLGCLVGFASLLVWSKHDQKAGETYRLALHRTFLEAYVKEPFLLALGFSVVGLVVGACLEFLFRLCVPVCREYPFYDLSKPLVEEDQEVKNETNEKVKSVEMA